MAEQRCNLSTKAKILLFILTFGFPILLIQGVMTVSEAFNSIRPDGSRAFGFGVYIICQISVLALAMACIGAFLYVLILVKSLRMSDAAKEVIKHFLRGVWILFKIREG